MLFPSKLIWYLGCFCAVAFAVYDKDGDGFVGPKDLRDVLRISMGKTLSDSELVKVGTQLTTLQGGAAPVH